MLNKSLRVWEPWFGMGCKVQTTAIAQLWRGFATPQTAQNRADRAAGDLFSVALTAIPGAAGLKTAFTRRAPTVSLAEALKAPAIPASAQRSEAPNF